MKVIDWTRCGGGNTRTEGKRDAVFKNQTEIHILGDVVLLERVREVDLAVARV